MIGKNGYASRGTTSNHVDWMLLGVRLPFQDIMMQSRDIGICNIAR